MSTWLELRAVVRKRWRRQFGQELAKSLRRVCTFLLITLLGSVFASAAVGEWGRWAGIAVATIYLAATVYIAIWVARRRAMHAFKPPRDRHDPRLVLATIYGPPPDEPLSVREMCAVAIICAVHEDLIDKQIALVLDCADQDVPVLLGLVPPKPKSAACLGGDHSAGAVRTGWNLLASGDESPYPFRRLVVGGSGGVNAAVPAVMP